MNSIGLRITISLLALLIAAAHLFAPDFDMDAIAITLLVVALVPWLAPLFKSVEIPGVGKIEFQDLQAMTEQAESSGLLQEPLKESCDFAFQQVIDLDPNLALAGLRIEIEKRLNSLILAYHGHQKFISPRQTIRLLKDKGIFTAQESDALHELISACNRAIHGERVTSEATGWVLDIGPRLIAYLDHKIALAPQQTNEQQVIKFLQESDRL